MKFKFLTIALFLLISICNATDWSNKQDVLAAVKQNGYVLKYADASFKKDKEVVLAAVKQNGDALKYADDSLKKDKEVVLAAVKESGWVLEYADASLKKDKEFILAAVKQYGWALKYADDSLTKDKEVVLAAIKKDGNALEYADASFKKDKEVVLAAIKKDGNALKYADASLKKDKEVVLAAVKQNSGALYYADDSLKKDKDIVALYKFGKEKENKILEKYYNKAKYCVISEKESEKCLHLASNEKDKKNYYKAMGIYKVMCDTNNKIGYSKGKSCYRFGYLYRNIFRDNIVTYKYYQKACNEGSAEACWNIGEDDKACNLGYSNDYCGSAELGL